VDRSAPPVTGIAGDASDERVAAAGADAAETAGTLAGCVNNAAVFRDAWLHEVPASVDRGEPGAAVTGCATAVRRYLAAGTPGAIVGAVVPVDGGRAVLGLDPEARRLGP
jgi:NAD(P)-dependent dehydrogenase (short-subunit alcohol dehydrogenase family)